MAWVAEWEPLRGVSGVRECLEAGWWDGGCVAEREGGEETPFMPREETKLADLTRPFPTEVDALELGLASARPFTPALAVALAPSCVCAAPDDDLTRRECERVNTGILEEREALLRDEPGRSSSSVEPQ